MDSDTDLGDAKILEQRRGDTASPTAKRDAGLSKKAAAGAVGQTLTDP